MSTGTGNGSGGSKMRFRFIGVSCPWPGKRQLWLAKSASELFEWMLYKHVIGVPVMFEVVDRKMKQS